MGQASRWGIWICAAWALALAVLAVANILLLTKAVELASEDSISPLQIWLIFGLNVVFGLAFAGSSYGLVRQHNWGRLVFIWAIVVWSGFNLVAVFLPTLIFAAAQPRSAGELTFNSLRFAAGMVLPLWYLNLPRVKALFYNNN